MSYDNMIQAAIDTLRGLFAERDRLCGIDDWDKLLGSLMLLEQVKQGIIKAMEEAEDNSEIESGDSGG